MKYTSIIAATALVGADAYNLKNQNKLYAAINDQELVQLEESKINEQGWSGIEAGMHEFPGTINEHGNWQDAYERVLPERFQGDAADGTAPVDKFTQNLIENYAVEGIDGKKIKDPKPNGTFYVSKETGRKLAEEVICTHFNKCGAAGAEFLNLKYDEAWKYYDVNNDGRIDAVGMTPQMLRHLCMPLGWVDI